VSSNKVVYLGFDVKNPTLSDLRIRQAIDLAINRNVLTSRLLRGLGKPSGQVVAPVTFGYSPDIKPTEFNPARAKELVAASGYKAHVPASNIGTGSL